MKIIEKIDNSALSITRKKYGKGFQYFDDSGKKITHKNTLKRFKKLVIPPMWTDVHICKFSDGHVQAFGRDLKGRKQYIYHSVWEKKQQEKKFEKMIDFSQALPNMRKVCIEGLKHKKWDRTKLLSLIILILDEYGFRIGNKQYVKKNQTFGLTTLRRKHLTIEDDELIFNFKGKSNQEREVHIDDP